MYLHGFQTMSSVVPLPSLLSSIFIFNFHISPFDVAFLLKKLSEELYHDFVSLHLIFFFFFSFCTLIVTHTHIDFFLSLSLSVSIYLSISISISRSIHICSYVCLCARTFYTYFVKVSVSVLHTSSWVKRRGSCCTKTGLWTVSIG